MIRNLPRENDCILEPLAWMDNPEEMARLAVRCRGISTVSGDFVARFLTGQMFAWFRHPLQVGSIQRGKFRQIRNAHQNSPDENQGINYKVMRTVTRAEVIAALGKWKPIDTPTRKRGHWYEVHGD